MCIEIISESTKNDPATEHIDEGLLHNIVIAESNKVYLTKQVDLENKEGYFVNYKSLCHKIADVIAEVKPAYPFPRSLATTLVETAHKQVFFSQHLPSLTEVKAGSNMNRQVIELLESFTSSVLNIKF
jgi:hypothetical protein